MQRNMITITSSASTPVKKRRSDAVAPSFVEPPVPVTVNTLPPATVRRGVAATAAAATAAAAPVATAPAAPLAQVAEKKPGRKRKQKVSADEKAENGIPVAAAASKKTSQQDTKLYCLCKTPYDESKLVLREIMLCLCCIFIKCETFVGNRKWRIECILLSRGSFILLSDVVIQFVDGFFQCNRI